MRQKFVERGLAPLAACQHGVVARAQLVALGLDDAAIRRRVRAGRLHRVHLGVYAVGHGRLTREGRFMAAVLSCGEGAALSHVAAAVLWRILPERDLGSTSRSRRAAAGSAAGS